MNFNLFLNIGLIPFLINSIIRVLLIKINFMKLYWTLIVASVIIFSTLSCKKKTNCDSPTTTAPASEVTTLANYISSNSISAVKDDRGFYYNIQAVGGDKPDACSTVKVNYSGSLTNGSVFDSANDISFPLANLIVGWQEGIPLIGSGGKIILYLPPSLGYGSSAQSGIPANSILIFTIELISF